MAYGLSRVQRLIQADESTLTLSGSTLSVKDGGVAAVKVAADVATQAELDAKKTALYSGMARTENGTRYWAPNDHFYTGADRGLTNVANMYAVAPRAMTLTGLSIVVFDGSGASAQVTLNVNGSDTALTATAAALDTVVHATDSIAIAKGDKLAIKVVCTNATEYVAWGLTE